MYAMYTLQFALLTLMIEYIDLAKGIQHSVSKLKKSSLWHGLY